MDRVYVIIVGILFILAISDLIVGVTNDAVNFLNSALGSKVAPVRVILIIAAMGILFGATFSSGMMEVARKGIFNPGEFYFSDLMIIFLAVMITDIILLDLFNTFGLPTSTTVSIVFELLGSAVGMATIKLARNPEAVHTIGTYINSGKALAIISGILLSVAVAFTVGALVMYLTRVLFSFNYKRNLKYYGSIWGGFAISVITYFILIKGAKGASFMSEEAVTWIAEHTGRLLLYSFMGWTVILQVLTWLFNLNIPRTIVLVGTFALAMAFAGNDLVNFIGVPLAGFESYKTWAASGVDPGALEMTALAAKVQTPTILLLFAGIVMAIALWLSKKARTVSNTEINLAKQNEGFELFESSQLARALVRISVSLSNGARKIIPSSVEGWMNKRFDASVAENLSAKGGVSFDLLRASINLVVASALIAYGTSQKLPLSTTYVTFMVAMGTSMADRAWGRETAVYRITGVIVVIGGWFLTAFAAFSASFLIALFINWAGIYAIALLAIVVILMLIRSYKIHLKRKSEYDDKERAQSYGELSSDEAILPECRDSLVSSILKISSLYDRVTISLNKNSRKGLKDTHKDVKALDKAVKLQKDSVFNFIRKLDDSKADAGPFYVQIFDYLREAAHSLYFISEPVFLHVDNNHEPLNKVQQDELKKFNLQLNEYLNYLVYILKSGNFENIKEALVKQQDLLKKNEEIRKLQLKRIKKGVDGTRRSMLYLNLLNESKNMILQTGNVLKSYRDFTIALTD
ncbi:MAG TPA: inorganic phosphate transporter [Bacteroidales bacterium]|nr:inorganic phosphate transporter [Bacteroidales bacterium]